MSTDPRWTEETEDAVAAAIYGVGDPTGEGIPWAKADEATRYVYRRRAIMALAMADALGVLIPPGGDVREEWAGQVWHDGDEPDNDGICPRESRWAAESMVNYHARQRAGNSDSAPVRRWNGNARLMRRTVHAGPWLPVTEGDETP